MSNAFLRTHGFDLGAIAALPEDGTCWMAGEASGDNVTLMDVDHLDNNHKTIFNNVDKEFSFGAVPHVWISIEMCQRKLGLAMSKRCVD